MSPSTDGLSGESKDLWIFYFTDLPDIADTLAKDLKGKYVIAPPNKCNILAVVCVQRMVMGVGKMA